jgi:anti-sigma regulatory factor (Ser/Thr protein kinase)
VFYVGETHRLIRSYRAVASSVPQARHELAELAAAAGATREELDAVRLAVSEALTNAVLHAYGEESPGSVHVSAAVADDELWVLISDDGDGLHAGGRRSGGLGVGLTLISKVTDSFSVVDQSSGGTEVRMGFRLARLRRPADDQSPRSCAASAARAASSRFSTTT